MGSGVRQRILFVESGEYGEQLGEEMQNRSTMSSHAERISMSGVCVERNGDMEGIGADAVASSISKGEAGRELSMGHQNSFGSEWPEEKVRQMTQNRIDWLKAYLTTGSPTEAAKIMGVRNVKEVSKRITKIARHLGFRTAREMKQAAGVKLQVEQTANHSQLMQLLKQQDFRCALSGEILSPTTARLDHKIAVSRGGSHDIENLQWVTDSVNRAKGTMSNEEFIAVCKAVSAWVT